MPTKDLNTLLKEANDIVKRLSYEESNLLIENYKTVIIDVREESEVYSLGIIKNAIHIPSCLLYTSPSPRDNSGSRMPSSA